MTGNDYEHIDVHYSHCPGCNNPVVYVSVQERGGKDYGYLAFPRYVTRPVPKEVPAKIAEDFQEASAVLPISEKASAALSRRCLEHLLDDRKISGKDLNEKIDKALKVVPPTLGENLDAIRQVGMYAAHPKKATDSGEIAEVEIGEADFSLDILEGLFDFFFVQPAKDGKIRQEINQKLAIIGKPPLKKP